MPDAIEPFGLVTDARGPLPVGAPTVGMPVRSARELARTVWAFAARAPHMLLFRAPAAPLLLVGVAGSRAAVEAFPSDTSVRSWTARAREPGVTALEVPFDGAPSVFPAAHVLSTEEAIGIVTFVAETGTLPAAYDWVNVHGAVLARGP